MHYHGAAANFLVYGLKGWVITPPHLAAFSTVPAAEMVHRLADQDAAARVQGDTNAEDTDRGVGEKAQHRGTDDRGRDQSTKTAPKQNLRCSSTSVLLLLPIMNARNLMKLISILFSIPVDGKNVIKALHSILLSFHFLLLFLVVLSGACKGQATWSCFLKTGGT